MYASLHNHTDHSNYRLYDSTNSISNLINTAIDKGISSLAITDHEAVGAHVEAIHYINSLREKNEKAKDFKLILGNEIYLCSRKSIQEDGERVFPHFILIAKNINGHRALRELSTIAWCENSFVWVNMRVPTFYDDLTRVVGQYKGDLIGSTACLGGALPRAILDAYSLNEENPDFSYCVKFISNMNNIFGEGNFFLELQPSTQEDQVKVNKALIELSKITNTKYIITTDSHYPTAEERSIHESFLNSQDGDREVKDFYAFTYIMTEEEIHEIMDSQIGYDNVQIGLDNTMLISDMCEEYSLDKPLDIPYIPSDIREPNVELYNKYKTNIPLLEYFYTSNYDSDRHLVRELVEKIEGNQEEFDNKETYDAIQTCLESIKLSSEKQNTPWSAYLLQTKLIVETCWESGSLVGCARGSGCGFLLLYMLGITQINPLREEVKTFHWRFLNPERVSPLDVDIDVQGEMRDVIIKNLQGKYNGYRHVSKIQTLLKAKSKNSIQIACRGLGYTNEEGVYLASFIQAERGIQYTLDQTFYGDEGNGIEPNEQFVTLMTTKYSDVWEIAKKIEGLCVGVGQHAGGVIVCKDDMVNSIALMKTKSGDVITQYDLHTAEACSLIKWDILAIDALGKIKTELDLLIKDGYIERQPTIKETYEKYLGVYKIDRNNPDIWGLINNHAILSLFQFEKSSGWQAIELGKPKNLEDMAALNSIMRLMASDDGITPLEKYSHHKKDIELWYKEMSDFGLTEEEQKWVETYALKNYGFLPNQENFMEIVQDERMGGYSLLWADKLRKSIAKKNPAAFTELEEEFYNNVKEKGLSYNLCHYVWSVLISMNKGYGFNSAHTLSYSIVALQEANLAYHYPMVYWNCANLISDSGGQDGTVNYGKIASAVGRMKKEGVIITPPYINEAQFDFRPDAENNRIIYGLKAINGVGASQANAIVANQPYSSLADFCQKMELAKENTELKMGDKAIIQLIKAGCFDKIENKPREEIMADYIRTISKPLSTLHMANIIDLYELGLLTQEQKENELRYYNFRKRLNNKENFYNQEGKSPTTVFYKVPNKKMQDYFDNVLKQHMQEKKDYEICGTDCVPAIKLGSLDRVINKLTKDFQIEVLGSKQMLAKVNESKFNKVWNEKAYGTIEKWEMQSVNYYYNKHELENVDKEYYGIVNYNQLPAEPEVIEETVFKNGGVRYRYKLSRICGTVIDKDANHNTVTLLTEDGVVTVKFYKGQFGFYNQSVAEKDEITGKKTVLEKTWFERGNMIMVTGFRRGEFFIPKKYDDSVYKHSLQLITGVDKMGILSLVSERVDADKEGENAVRI